MPSHRHSAIAAHLPRPPVPLSSPLAPCCSHLQQIHSASPPPAGRPSAPSWWQGMQDAQRSACSSGPNAHMPRGSGHAVPITCRAPTRSDPMPKHAAMQVPPCLAPCLQRGLNRNRSAGRQLAGALQRGGIQPRGRAHAHALEHQVCADLFAGGGGQRGRSRLAVRQAAPVAAGSRRGARWSQGRVGSR